LDEITVLELSASDSREGLQRKLERDVAVEVNDLPQE
jgi:hypothetical protein